MTHIVREVDKPGSSMFCANKLILLVCMKCLSEGPGPSCSRVDNAIHWINHYPLDIAIGFAITYPVDSDLSGG